MHQLLYHTQYLNISEHYIHVFEKRPTIHSDKLGKLNANQSIEITRDHGKDIAMTPQARPNTWYDTLLSQEQQPSDSHLRLTTVQSHAPLSSFHEQHHSSDKDVPNKADKPRILSLSRPNCSPCQTKKLAVDLLDSLLVPSHIPVTTVPTSHDIAAGQPGVLEVSLSRTDCRKKSR